MSILLAKIELLRKQVNIAQLGGCCTSGLQFSGLLFRSAAQTVDYLVHSYIVRKGVPFALVFERSTLTTSKWYVLVRRLLFQKADVPTVSWRN